MRRVVGIPLIAGSYLITVNGCATLLHAAGQGMQLQLLMRLVKVGGALLLELVEQVADWLVRLANGRIDIPWVTDFIETTILRGRPLTLLSLFSVIVAVPYTIIYKIAKGTTEGPFAEFASFAAQDEVDKAKVQAEIEAQIEAALAETEKVTAEAEKKRQTMGHVKAACGLFGGALCSIATMIADLGDEKNMASRAARLVAAIIGATIAGITGFPTEGTKLERGLATTRIAKRFARNNPKGRVYRTASRVFNAAQGRAYLSRAHA